jgi:3-oxoacyl-[acyl-carrier protein] reductase
VRHALVTGAGSGIGLATAMHFVRAGWQVSFNVFDASFEQAAYERIGELARADASVNDRCLVLRADVADDAQCRSMVGTSLNRFGRMDALVNAAGITRFCDEADLEGIQAADFQAIYAVNTIGTFQMARACAPALRDSTKANVNKEDRDAERISSSIVNLSSYAGIHGGGSSLAYGASKAAVNAVTLSLARALAPEVRVNAVCPALVAEGFVERLQPESFVERAARQVERTPLKRVGKPSEIAETIFWICTGAALMTGEIIQLDAGLHLQAR